MSGLVMIVEYHNVVVVSLIITPHTLKCLCNSVSVKIYVRNPFFFLKHSFSLTQAVKVGSSP